MTSENVFNGCEFRNYIFISLPEISGANFQNEEFIKREKRQMNEERVYKIIT